MVQGLTFRVEKFPYRGIAVLKKFKYDEGYVKDWQGAKDRPEPIMRLAFRVANIAGCRLYWHFQPPI